jgi:hypothetical protein
MPVGNVGTFSGFGYGTNTGTVREDLYGVISNIDPSEAPAFNSFPKSQCKAPTHQWLVETLGATTTAGAVEGEDWGLNTATSRPTRLENYTVITRKDIQISETVRAVDHAGFKDAYQREVAKGMREVVRNSEIMLWQVPSASASTGSSVTARMIRAFQYWQTATTVSVNVTAQLSASSGIALNNAMNNAWNNGASPEQCYVSGPIKRIISQFTAPQQNRNVVAAEKRLTNVIDFYDTDFGPLEIVLDRWIPTAAASSTTYAAGNHIWLLTKGQNRIAMLRPLMHVLVGKRGDSTAGFILQEWTLEVLNPSANYFVYGLPSG